MGNEEQDLACEPERQMGNAQAAPAAALTDDVEGGDFHRPNDRNESDSDPNHSRADMNAAAAQAGQSEIAAPSQEGPAAGPAPAAAPNPNDGEFGLPFEYRQ